MNISFGPPVMTKIEVFLNSGSFSESIPPLEIDAAHRWSYFKTRMEEYAKMIYQLRPETQSITFKMDGYTLTKDVQTVIEDSNVKEPYRDSEGY